MTQFFEYLILGLTRGSMYALIALGYTLVYGVLQLINFAHSEIFMSGAFGSFLGIQAGIGSGKAPAGWARRPQAGLPDQRHRRLVLPLDVRQQAVQQPDGQPVPGVLQQEQEPLLDRR